jgi:glutamate synthase domain-containing protein 3
MTGGTVVVLGSTGRNFAAGMSGGIAYVFDDKGDFSTRCNQQMVGLEKLSEASEAEAVRKLIESHVNYTGSEHARRILENWSANTGKFVKVMPKDYKRVLQALDEAKKQGLTGEEAIMAAFEKNAKDESRVGGG